jgi:hypothetical protein
MEYLGDLRKLPPMPSMADKVDLAERFIYLDCVMFMDRAVSKRRSIFPVARLLTRPIDWEDAALRIGNSCFDRLAVAMREKDPVTRRKRLAETEKELKELRCSAVLELLGVVVLELLDCSGTTLGLLGALGRDLYADKVVGKTLGNFAAARLVPWGKVQAAADRSEQLQNNLYLAFALAAYRRDHGRYPEKLAALAPKYLPKVPQDMFSGKPLVYEPSEKGYLFYSVGVNGRDEQGRGYDDEPAGDDLAVRMPLPKPPK